MTPATDDLLDLSQLSRGVTVHMCEWPLLWVWENISFVRDFTIDMVIQQLREIIKYTGIAGNWGQLCLSLNLVFLKNSFFLHTVKGNSNSQYQYFFFLIVSFFNSATHVRVNPPPNFPLQAGRARRPYSDSQPLLLYSNTRIRTLSLTDHLREGYN